MDIQGILNWLMSGSNPIIILVAFLLFKDQILAIFKPKPVDPAPVPVPTPAPSPVITVPTDHPIVDVIVKDVLPILLPLVVNLLKQQQDAAKAAPPANAS